jgi:hypothetical protein
MSVTNTSHLSLTNGPKYFTQSPCRYFRFKNVFTYLINYVQKSPSEANSRSAGPQLHSNITILPSAPRSSKWSSIQISRPKLCKHFSSLPFVLHAPSIHPIDLITLIIHKSITIKVKLSLCLTKHQAMKMYWGSRGIAPRILDLGTRRR